MPRPPRTDFSNELDRREDSIDVAGLRPAHSATFIDDWFGDKPNRSPRQRRAAVDLGRRKRCPNPVQAALDLLQIAHPRLHHAFDAGILPACLSKSQSATYPKRFVMSLQHAPR